MTRTKAIGLFRLFRFELPFTAGMCVVVGEFLALGSVPHISEIALGFLSFFFISATALILNDYFDYETDKINAPERPLPSGMVSKRDVVLLSVVVALLGLGASSMVNMTALFVAAVVWLIGVLYNWRLKRTGVWGNLLVSISVGMTFIFGGIVVGNLWEPAVWWFSVTAVLINLGEEIAADAMDILGDRKAGSRSLAVLFGQKKALRISAVLFTMVILISSLPFILGWFEPLYLLPIGIMDVIILYSTIRLMNPGSSNPRKYVRWIYLSGLLAILMIILIRVVR